MGLLPKLLDRESSFRHSFNAKPAVEKYQIVRIHLEQGGGELSRLFFTLPRRLIDGDSAHCSRPATKSADTLRHSSGIAMDYLDILQRDTQFIGNDLRKGGLLPLAVRRRARQHRDFSIGLHLHLAVLPHSLRTHGADLNISRHADP